MQRINNIFLAPHVHSFYVLFIAPRKINEEEQRKEFILNVILAGTILFVSLFEAIILTEYIRMYIFGVAYTGISPLLFTGIFLIPIFLLYLSRIGFPKASALIIIILYLAGTTMTAFVWGTDLYQVILTYLLIIVISSILLDTWWAFGITASISAILIILTILNTHKIISFDQDWKNDQPELNDIVEFCITYAMTLLVCWLSNREIGKSLNRAHASENALRKQNESLEEIVEDRTRALREAQAEKVSHLYHFAEFGRLSSGIFHDLVNPLTLVALHMEQLGSISRQNPDRDIVAIKAHVDQAILASREMENFIITVRKQMAVNDGQIMFNLNEQIRETIHLLTHKALTSGIAIRFKSRRNIRTYGSPSKFQQITTNLISNAIDAYHGLKISPERQTILITLEKKSDNVCIMVRDHGCGIPAEQLNKIFDPFFTTKMNYRGMGLGLSNTKSAVEKNFGGVLTVESIEQIGSTFIIFFPIKKHGTNLPDTSDG